MKRPPFSWNVHFMVLCFLQIFISRGEYIYIYSRAPYNPTQTCQLKHQFPCSHSSLIHTTMGPSIPPVPAKIYACQLKPQCLPSIPIPPKEKVPRRQRINLHFPEMFISWSYGSCSVCIWIRRVSTNGTESAEWGSWVSRVRSFNSAQSEEL